MMNGRSVVDFIKSKFPDTGAPEKILLQKSVEFTVHLVEDGLVVDNLGALPFLPWKVFEETVNLLTRNGGKAEYGDAIESTLGEKGLSLDSVEGHVAHVVYGKHIGDSVFRRIAPIAAILIWAGICESAPGGLILLAA